MAMNVAWSIGAAREILRPFGLRMTSEWDVAIVDT